MYIRLVHDPNAREENSMYMYILKGKHKTVMSGVARRRKVGGGGGPQTFFSRKVKSKKKKKKKKGRSGVKAQDGGVVDRGRA